MRDSFNAKALPKELQAARQWLTHVNKVPQQKPNSFQQEGKGLTLQQALAAAQDDPRVGLGVMFGTATQLACIDIDAPDEVKHNWQDYAPDLHIASQEYSEWLCQQPWITDALQQLPIPTLPSLCYTDLSPSGSGVHIWLNITDKHITSSAYIKSTNPLFHGQISLHSSYVTCTAVPLHSTSSTLLPMSLHAFANVFGKTTPPQSADQASITASSVQPQSLPPLQHVLDALQLLPAVPTPALQQQYQLAVGDTYEHYTYWLKVGMALHNYGQKTKQQIRMFEAYLEWSKKDTLSFKSDEDVEAHWRSFGTDADISQTAPITIRTLIHLANNVVFQYPKPVYKDNKATRYPKINEYANFQYLMDKYNIKTHNDQSGGIYVSGDTDIMERYFQFPAMAPPVLDKFHGPYSQNGLVTATTQLCQNAAWQGLQNTKNLVSQWVERAQLLDIFQEWMDTPFDDLPERYRMIRTSSRLIDAREYDRNSNAEFLFSCLNVKPQAGSSASREEEIELYYACLEKTLYHIVKYREASIRQSYRNDSGGMLILVGPEHTYKSTFCRMLLPVALQSLRKEVNTQINNAKAERDFIRYLGSKAIVQLDEFEGMMSMKTHSSFFKNLLSSDNMSQVDIYNTSETQMPRKAIIIATTNEVQHVLSREGSRRLWFIPTGTIDTSKAQLFNHHKFYNDMRKTLRIEYAKSNLVWQLTKQQSAVRSSWNNAYAASSSLASIIEEIWPFLSTEMPKDYISKDVDLRRPKERGNKLMRTTDVAAVIREYGYSVNIAQLKHELHRFCSAWTNTQVYEKEVRIGVVKIIHGKACQGWYAERRRYQYEYWVMPPLVRGVNSGMYTQSEDDDNDEIMD